MKKPLSLYIHIPFCVRKCLYCDFPSYSGCEGIYSEYVNVLCRELKDWSGRFNEYKVNTVFIGGGTPTVLKPSDLGRVMDTVLNRFDVDAHAEITCEANPGTLDLKKLTEMRSMEINRLSMGVQAWQNDILKRLGRIHDRDTFVNDMSLAREAGFGNINCDIMFSLPGQSMDNWQETLERITDLKPEHISAYSLIIEEGTPFKEMYDKGTFKPAEDETDRKMYYLSKEILKDRGYLQYEISNFAREGFESRHNSVYWKTMEYAGFGLGSHSYIDKRRFHNTYDMKKYMEYKGNGSITEEMECLSENDIISEFMFMGLRMTRGVSETDFEDRFKKTVESVYHKEIKMLINEGLIKWENGRIFLTDYGMDISNYVFEKFLL
ncbi:radical SAM family heme chaperone HemW [Lachnospiraceae bacterium NSJ-143]|nr:radical SAM family heme chaperone HemW [Lachnospiraceae bacterium NSJ-143]